MANRQLDVFRNPFGLIDRVAVFRDRADDAEMIHFLQRTAAKVLEGTLTAEDENGRIRTPGVGDAGYAVRDAGAGRDRRNADLAGITARPGIGRMNRRLFVAHIDDLDSFVDASVIDRHDMAAGEREDDFNAGLLEGLGRKFSTVKGHGGSPS